MGESFDDSQNGSGSEATLSPKSGDKLRMDSKVCGVCGDKALGNNFNAITCESCKAFFRRNALKTKEFHCPFTNDCKVDAVTRRFCQKCRLKKCIDIGMKKEWIMTDEEKKIKKKKIEQNRTKRHHSTTGGDASETPPSKSACLSSCDDSSSPGTTLSTPVSSSVSANEEAEAVASMTMTDLSGSTHHQQSPLAPAVQTKQTLMADNMRFDQGESSTSTTNSPFAEPLGSPAVKMEVASNTTTTVMQQKNEAEMPLLSSLVKKSVVGGSPIPMTSGVLSPSIAEPYEQSHTAALAEPANVIRLQYAVDAARSDCYPQNHLEIGSAADAKNSQVGHAGTHHMSFDVNAAASHEVGSIQDVYSAYLQSIPGAGTYSSQDAMDAILSVAIQAEFQDFQLFAEESDERNFVGSNSGNERTLNKMEQRKLNELLMASHALNAPVDAEGAVKVSDPSLINVINLTDIAIRRLIKMSKKISGFKTMCQEDQIALLKGGCTEMMILRSVVSYDPDRDSWNIPHSNIGYNIKLGVLKEARGNLYEEHQRFVKSFKSDWRTDENIMMLLCAITLFTAERPNVIHKDVVKFEQDCYLYLLKRYLESSLNGCEARSTYLELIRRISELRVLNSNHLRVFLEVNPREVEPLLLEIFDLK